MSADQAADLEAEAVVAALEAAGAAAFSWDPERDRIALAGARAALGLASLDAAARWSAFVAAFVEADRAEIDDLREPDRPRAVVLARLTAPGGRWRRVRVRAAWRDGVLAGVIVPAFGADGEAAERGRIGLETALRRALVYGELEAWFQPVVRLSDERPVGFETLVRWPAPEGGVLAPDDFLPLAAETGLIAQIGSAMRRAAAEQLGLWRVEGIAPEFVAVNLTIAELERPDLADSVAKLIKAAQLPPGALKLEITEGEVIRDPDAAAVVLDALKAAGASLALDDFGAGATSLAWLERFPFDVVKIDRYFVRTLAASESSARIVQSIINLAHDLGLKVTAEGMEDAETAQRLAEMGCDYAQGYWFAPALIGEEAGAYLRGNR